jgi:hypothetical protein
VRAVWSFWSKPHLAARNFIWHTELHHRLSWVLSVESARPHFASTALCTDKAGAELLVEQLGLHFDNVSTSLESLARDDPDWWTLGKLQCYAEQYEPFLHIDSDVYLFRPLPEPLLHAPLIAQHPERITGALPWYDIEGCEMAIRSRGDGEIPEAWSWYRTFSPVQEAACCGIVGGNATEFMRRYAETVLHLLRSPRNRHAFESWQDKRVLNPFFEQYLLSACAANEGVPITYLFDSHEHAAAGAAVQMGFTHLMAGAKADAKFARRLELRLERDYPQAYERCLDSVINQATNTEQAVASRSS